MFNLIMFWKIWEFIQMCNVLNCTIFFHKWNIFCQKPFIDAFNKIWTNIISYLRKTHNIWKLLRVVVTNINIFTKTFIFWENILRQIIIKIHSKIHKNQSLFKNALREQHLYYLKFPGIKYYLNTGMLLTNALNYAIIWNFIMGYYY